MRIELTSIFVDDQRAALAFYTDMLDFTKHHEVPIGEDAWLTVVPSEPPDGPELVLEPAEHPAVRHSGTRWPTTAYPASSSPTTTSRPSTSR